MSTRLFKAFMGVFVVCIVLTACVNAPAPTPPSPVPTPVVSPLQPTKAPTFSSTTGAVVGHVNLPAEWKSARVYLAPFYPDNTGQSGFFLLEPSIHRSVDMGLDDYFQVSDVEPGQYVIVIGPSPEETLAITSENGQPRVFTIEAGKMLNVGEARLMSQ